MHSRVLACAILSTAVGSSSSSSSNAAQIMSCSSTAGSVVEHGGVRFTVVTFFLFSSFIDNQHNPPFKYYVFSVCVFFWGDACVTDAHLMCLETVDSSNKYVLADVLVYVSHVRILCCTIFFNNIIAPQRYLRNACCGCVTLPLTLIAPYRYSRNACCGCKSRRTTTGAVLRWSTGACQRPRLPTLSALPAH